MTSLEVVYRETAVADLEFIYMAVLGLSSSYDTARGYVARIEDRCRRIGRAPLIGRPRDDLFPGLRTVAFERRALIAYRVTSAQVEITNVFWAGRDVDALLSGDYPDAD